MMLDELETECREMVKRGMSVLTTDQRNKVDLEKLDMESAYDCIIGQIYGDFADGTSVLFGIESTYAIEAAEKHGFCVPLDAPNYFTRYAFLGRIWREMLETERTVSEMEALLKPVGSF